jgi:hypothetical protein
VTKIFDNISNRLGDHLRATMPGYERMDVAVGYFNLRGWKIFDDLVAAKAPAPAEAHSTEPGDAAAASGAEGPAIARILLGMVTGTDQAATIAELQADLDGTPQVEADAATGRARKAKLLEHLRDQLMRGAPTAADRATLASLRNQLAQGVVEMKVFTRRPLHGKTYLLPWSGSSGRPI